MTWRGPGQDPDRGRWRRSVIGFDPLAFRIRGHPRHGAEVTPGRCHIACGCCRCPSATAAYPAMTATMTPTMTSFQSAAPTAA